MTNVSDKGTGDPLSPRTAVDPRHNDKTGAVFVDGHAQIEPPERLGYVRKENGVFIQGNNTFFSGAGSDLDPPRKY